MLLSSFLLSSLIITNNWIIFSSLLFSLGSDGTASHYRLAKVTMKLQDVTCLALCWQPVFTFFWNRSFVGPSTPLGPVGCKSTSLWALPLSWEETPVPFVTSRRSVFSIAASFSSHFVWSKGKKYRSRLFSFDSRGVRWQATGMCYCHMCPSGVFV